MLSGKNVIITGCARGMGKAMLELFASNGANIFACVRSNTDEFKKLCNDLVGKYNVNITIIVLDLSNQESVKSAAKEIIGKKVPIHGLVNNAGVTYNALFQMTSMDKLREIFEVNFFSQFQFTQYISKIMVRQRFGSIVNVSSSAAIDGNPGKSAYGATKASLLCMSKVMANELGEYGIRVNTIAPGITNTDMVYSSMTEDIINKSIEDTKLKRIGEPIDVANAVMFLISDNSTYITGQVLRVDGGIGR